MLDGLPAEVRRQLAARGAEPDAIAALVDAEPGDPVLLAGSYALGEANPTSDLDLLVLTGHGRTARGDGLVNHPSLLGDSFDGKAGDLVVNVEYVPIRIVDSLASLVAAATSTQPPGMPNLQGMEMRLAHRLSTGLVLAGHEQVAGWRARLDYETVRASASALAFIGALSLLEDTTVVPSPDREYLCRCAAESLLLSAVSAFGPLTYDAKHLLSRAATLAGGAGMPRLFAERERLIFVDRLPMEQARELVIDLADDLYRCMGANCPPVLARMLAPACGAWAWTGRAFGTPAAGTACPT